MSPLFYMDIFWKWTSLWIHITGHLTPIWSHFKWAKVVFNSLCVVASFLCGMENFNNKKFGHSGAYLYRRTHRLQAEPMEWYSLTSRIAEAIFSWITRTSYPFQYVWSLYQYHKYVCTVVYKAFDLFLSLCCVIFAFISCS